MPYADPEQQREYQRQWIAKRRAEWLEQHGPCVVCGSWDNLEVDHIDPATKLTHNVWSLGKAKREAELAKCQVLCREHHVEKSTAQDDWQNVGERNAGSVLTEDDVRTIRRIYKRYDPEFGGAALGRKYGVSKFAISDIILRKRWKHI